MEHIAWVAYSIICVVQGYTIWALRKILKLETRWRKEAVQYADSIAQMKTGGVQRFTKPLMEHVENLEKIIESQKKYQSNDFSDLKETIDCLSNEIHDLHDKGTELDSLFTAIDSILEE